VAGFMRGTVAATSLMQAIDQATTMQKAPDCLPAWVEEMGR
jgi:hypothetical protein